MHAEGQLRPHDCIKVCGLIAWQSFLVNNFGAFPDVVQVKKMKILFGHRCHFLPATSSIGTDISFMRIPDTLRKVT